MPHIRSDSLKVQAGEKNPTFQQVLSGCLKGFIYICKINVNIGGENQLLGLECTFAVIRSSYDQMKPKTRRTMKFPVLLEQAKSLGGWASILSLSLVDVRYSAFPPRASQNSSARTHCNIKMVALS